MKEEHRRALDEGRLPAPLAEALRELDRVAQPVIESAAHPGLQGRLTHFLTRIFAHALEPEANEVHFWETFLAFLVMEEEEQGGGACAAAAGRLQPLLSDYLGPYDEVTLQEITEKTVVGVCLLSETLRTPQKYAVAPNAYSLAQALFSPAAWYRAVFAGKAPVGFIMLSDRPDEPEYFLWRFMIAPHFQGRGYGRAAIDRLVDYVRTRPGAQELLVSCILGDGSPLAFYERVGFVSTGKMEGDELVLKMAL